MVNDFITANNNQITVYDLINKFEQDPFGWRFEAVLDVLVSLVKKKKREFVYKGQQRYPIIDFINKAVTTSERLSCEVVTGEEIDQVLLDEVVYTYKVIFNETLPASSDKNELYDNLISALNKKLVFFQPLENDYYGAYPFGNCFQKAVHELNTWISNRDPKKLFKSFTESQSESKELFDLAKGMEDFINANLRDYKQLRTFVIDNKENFKELSSDDQEKAQKIEDFTKLNDPRREFRHAKKAYDELAEALKTHTQELKKEVKKVYEEIFTELETEAKKRKVESDKYANKEYTINGIDNINSIAQLKNKKLSASNFKSAELQKIIAATPVPEGSRVAESASYYITRGVSTITTIEEMDAYLESVREEMVKILKDNKTIILK
jgi:hypothetical protein